MSVDTCEHGNPRGTCDVTPHRCAIERISLRDEVAMRALQGILSNNFAKLDKKLADEAYKWADLMLEARKG